MASRVLTILYAALSGLHQAATWLMQRVWLAGDALGSRVRSSLQMALALATLAFLAGVIAWRAAEWLADRAIRIWFLADEAVVQVNRIADSGVLALWTRAGLIVGLLCGAAVLIALLRKRLTWWLLNGIVLLYALWWLWGFALVRGIPIRLAQLAPKAYDNTVRNEHWIALGLLWLALAVVPVVALILLHRRATRDAYMPEATRPYAWADRFVQFLQSGGEDPRFSTSVYWAMVLALFVLVFPFMMRSCGMEDPYGLIKGKGEPQVTVVQVKKKPKKRREYIVNAWSPYIFKQPDIDDMQVLDTLEEVTSDTYTAQTGKSALGKGGPGKGGWPHGMMDGKIRFIRLEYDGGDWDQDMGKGADYNLLVRFREITGFKIADDTESLRIARLRRFPEHRAPPFVFMTGKGDIRVSSSDVATLRWYCLEEGGCLFIDNGGGTFHSSVTALLRRVFPDKNLVEIASDDPIFRAPFVFPNGAPPFWHHAGHRAMGIKHNGRWVVFYHPGDINDAWKTGHSGASEQVAEQAYRLGINVMYYTFNQYHRIHFEQ